MSYARALERLRTLGLANNALNLALEQAIDDLVTAAHEDRGESVPLLVKADGTPPNRRDSGIRRRSPNLEREIGAVEVERYVRSAWQNARDEDDFERVRTLLRKSIESGMLNEVAADRLARLVAA